MNTSEEIARKIKDPKAREHYRLLSKKKNIVQQVLEKTFELDDCIVVTDPVKKRIDIYEK